MYQQAQKSNAIAMMSFAIATQAALQLAQSQAPKDAQPRNDGGYSDADRRRLVSGRTLSALGELI